MYFYFSSEKKIRQRKCLILRLVAVHFDIKIECTISLLCFCVNEPDSSGFFTLTVIEYQKEMMENFEFIMSQQSELFNLKNKCLPNSINTRIKFNTFVRINTYITYVYLYKKTPSIQTHNYSQNASGKFASCPFAPCATGMVLFNC